MEIVDCCGGKGAAESRIVNVVKVCRKSNRCCFHRKNCEAEDSASAVLIRALMPTTGLAAMRRRRGVRDEGQLCAGPGRLCEALAVTDAHNGAPLDRAPFALFARTGPVEIVAGPRIGISKAVELSWRYGWAGSRFLSRPFKAGTTS